MTIKDVDTLLADLLVSFPNNTSEDITPAILRSQQTDIIESYLNFLSDTPEVRRISSEQDWIDNTSDLGGGIRQMQNNFTYLISGPVDHSFTIRAQGVNRISSDNVISSSNNYTGSGLAYSVTSVTEGISFDNITLTGAAGSTWMTATDGLFIATERCSVQFPHPGVIDALILFMIYTRIGNVGSEITTALTFAGTGQVSFDIVSCAFFPDQATSIPCINIGSSTWGDLRIESSKFNLGTNNEAINGLSSGGNLINAGFVNHCDMTGSTFAVLGVSPADDPWVFTGNLGVLDSSTSLAGSVENNTTETVIGTVDTPIQVNVGVLAQSYESERMSMSTAGVITNQGINPVRRFVLFTGLADAAAGNNVPYTFYVAKNGVVINGSHSSVSLDSADPGRFAAQALVDVSSSDTISLFVEENAGTTNITITDFTVTVN